MTWTVDRPREESAVKVQKLINAAVQPVEISSFYIHRHIVCRQNDPTFSTLNTFLRGPVVPRQPPFAISFSQFKWCLENSNGGKRR